MELASKELMIRILLGRESVVGGVLTGSEDEVLLLIQKMPASKRTRRVFAFNDRFISFFKAKYFKIDWAEKNK
jgi:hypothetical protein